MTNQPSPHDEALAAIDGRIVMQFNASRSNLLAIRAAEDQEAIKRNESDADRNKRHAEWEKQDRDALEAARKLGHDVYAKAREDHGEIMAAQMATMNAVGLPLDPVRRQAIIEDRLEQHDAASKQLTGNGEHTAILDGTMQTGVAQAQPVISDFEHSDIVRRLGPSLARAVTFFPVEAAAEQEARFAGSGAAPAQRDPVTGFMPSRDRRYVAGQITSSPDEQKKLLQETKRRQGWGSQAQRMPFPGPFDNVRPRA